MAEVAIIPKKKIARMQQNLSTIRKIAGWTTEELAYKMDVTKQTICNLESGRTPMSFAQYFLLRAILDCEIETDEVLRKVLPLLLESEEDDYNKVKDQAAIIAASVAGGVASAALLGVLPALIPIGVVAWVPIAKLMKTMFRK